MIVTVPAKLQELIIIQKPFAITGNWTASVEVEDVESHPANRKKLTCRGYAHCDRFRGNQRHVLKGVRRGQIAVRVSRIAGNRLCSHKPIRVVETVSDSQVICRVAGKQKGTVDVAGVLCFRRHVVVGDSGQHPVALSLVYLVYRTG